MLLTQLYQTWFGRLRAQVSGERVTRVRNAAWMIVGLFVSRSVHLEQIARKLPIRAKKLSLSRRMRRFLDNAEVRVRPWYEATARWLLHSAYVSGQIRLLMDSTRVSHDHRLLMVAVAFRRRALPIAWTWKRSHQGHTTAATQIALLRYMRTLLPAKAQVVLVGDGEHGRRALVGQLQQWGWGYALRQAGRIGVRPQPGADWIRLDQIQLSPGQSCWLPDAELSQSQPIHTGLLLHWQPGEDRPWFLVTNLASGWATLRAYRYRMWIEELFGDLKGHGFDLEATRLRTVQRLSRLTLLVCWLYVALLGLGEHVWRSGQRTEVDRTDRRDLSIFRLGWDWLERRLALNDPLPPIRWPTLAKLSGR